MHANRDGKGRGWEEKERKSPTRHASSVLFFRSNPASCCTAAAPGRQIACEKKNMQRQRRCAGARPGPSNYAALKLACALG